MVWDAEGAVSNFTLAARSISRPGAMRYNLQSCWTTQARVPFPLCAVPLPGEPLAGLDFMGKDMPGLTTLEARARLTEFGPNTLPEPKAPSFLVIFLRQFLSPLIYILVAAAVVAMAIGDVKDAIFIAIVLVINGVIGAVQEYSAGQAAAALREHDQPHAFVIRDGVQQEVDARDLVPGDFVLL